MSFFPVLLGAETLSPRYRWRLLDRLFRSWRPQVQGCSAFAAVALVCFIDTRYPIFVALLVASAVVLAARLLHGKRYVRLSQGAAGRRQSPEVWAWQFSVGAVMSAALWFPMDVAVVGAPDERLPFFVLAVQAGWLGSSSPRTSALPAAAFLQGVFVLIPVSFYGLFTHDRFLMLLAPFGILQLAATVGITRAVGGQLIAALLSEQHLEAANARLTELSATDGLTGIANRRAFEAIFQTEWARAAREGTDLAVLMIDVDSFKAYNDGYGHPAGDDCLRMVAELIVATLRRPPDIGARFGGEEFVALLPGTDGAAAAEVAERVRVTIMESGVAHAGSSFGRVTVSVGSASLAPHPGQDRQVLIDLADRALYEAKQSGRNAVRCAGRGLRIGAWGDYCTATSSTSKISVAPGGMTPPAPRLP